MDEYREDLYEWISDASKDATGCRMRYDISLYSNQELLALADSWQAQAEEQMLEEAEMKVQDLITFEKLITDTIECGAGDRETAIRWLVEAMDDNDMEYGFDMFAYRHNLPDNYDALTGKTKVWEDGAWRVAA